MDSPLSDFTRFKLDKYKEDAVLLEKLREIQKNPEKKKESS